MSRSVPYPCSRGVFFEVLFFTLLRDAKRTTTTSFVAWRFLALRVFFFGLRRRRGAGGAGEAFPALPGGVGVAGHGVSELRRRRDVWPGAEGGGVRRGGEGGSGVRWFEQVMRNTDFDS